MSITSTLHLDVRGRAREVLEFYHSVFGGDLVLAPYGDVEAGQSAAQSEQIAWGQATAPNGFHVMALDVQDALPYAAGENAFSVSVRGTESAEIERFGTALAESGGRASTSRSDRRCSRRSTAS